MSFVWTAESIKWFEAAAVKTDFYQGIVDKCRSLLNPEDTWLDLGCGTGELSLALASVLDSGTAIDCEERIIDCLNKKCRQQEIENLELVVGDWLTYNFTARYDIVYLSYLDGLTTQLPRLTSLAKKYIVAILPQAGEYNPFQFNKFCRRKNINRETTLQVENYLQQQGVEFEIIEHWTEFGQPLQDFEEYRKFLEFYFGIDDFAAIKRIADDYLQNYKDGYYLPNKKASAIIIISVS